VIILLAFSLIFSPMISSLHHRGEREKLNELFKVSTKWGLYVSLPLVLVVVFMPAQLMRVLYGASYANGDKVLMVLMLAQLINTATGGVAPLLAMTGHQNRLFLRTGLSFVVCIILNVLLVLVLDW